MNAHTQQLVIWLFMSLVLTVPAYIAMRHDANKAFGNYLLCKENAEKGGTETMPTGWIVTAEEWAERADSWLTHAKRGNKLAVMVLWVIPAFCAVFIILFGW